MYCEEWYRQKLELTNTEIELEHLKQKKKVCKGKVSILGINLRIAIWNKYIKKLKKRIAYIEEREGD